jgi:glycosyltransferase involved in cell wall biosynthesis
MGSRDFRTDKVKIIILNVQAPFVSGGAEYLAFSLEYKLKERGHEVEIVRIPFKWYPPESILKHMLACRLLKLENADEVIALKFPAYLAPFPNKKLWLLHQFRQVYELWGTQYQEFPNTVEGNAIRDMIVNADNHHLREAKAIYTNSKIVANRLYTHNQIEVNAVLYPPLLHPEHFYPGEFGDYFFYPSRMVTVKRQELAIEAMRHVKSNFRLVLAGKADSEAYDRHLRQLVKRYNLDDKVTILGYISDEEKSRLMSNAFASLYIPYDEDSYGYVTLEAFHSHKPVITLTDSGGTDEVISHDFNGLMLEPTPQALAAGMERMWANRKWTMEMGESAYESLQTYNIRWDYVLDNLLS